MTAIPTCATNAGSGAGTTRPVDEAGVGPMAVRWSRRRCYSRPRFIKGVHDSSSTPSGATNFTRSSRRALIGTGLAEVTTDASTSTGRQRASGQGGAAGPGTCWSTADYRDTQTQSWRRKSFCIAAASILAKVTRDRIMIAYDEQYPGYGFAQHKGYCTSDHMQLLEQLGPSPIHRRSFSPVAATAQLKLI